MMDEKKEKALADFTEMMKGLYGEELVSLNLYGEAAADEPGGNHRPVKLLAVLNMVGPSQLKKYAGVNARWLKKGIPAPLMLTQDTLKTSTDVFPIEFLEMKESYRLLHGKDILAGLVIGDENLRRECEEQLKGKYIHLRQEYIEVSGDKKAFTRLIAASVEPFTEVMRNILRLQGKGAPVKKDVIIKEFCRETSLDDAPFMGVLAVRRGGLSPSTEELDRLYAAYLAEVGRMAEFIDKMAM
jgi:hypothetical protein